MLLCIINPTTFTWYRLHISLTTISNNIIYPNVRISLRFVPFGANQTHFEAKAAIPGVGGFS